MQILASSTADTGFPRFLDERFDDWYAAFAAGYRHGLRDPAAWTPPEALAALRSPGSWERDHVLLAVGPDGTVLGGALVDVPLRDNLELLSFELAVAPEHRRAGVGSALLAAVCDVADAEGRTRVLTEVARPLDADEDWPGTAFARRAGFTVGIEDARRDLALPPDDALLDRLVQEALPHAKGYRWTVLRGVPGPADVEAVAELSSRMGSEAPQGDLDVEPDTFDAARVVELHERGSQQGRELWTALAREAGGAVAAYSVLARSEHQPDVLMQWDTLVLPEHRGHRLGLLLKVAALQHLREVARAEGWCAGLRVVRTWNAVSNRPMIAVNEAMGFRPAELLAEHQADVAAVRAALGPRAGGPA